MEIKKVLEEFNAGVKKLYGNKLKEVILYGSWARGEATDDSDIDLLVVVKTDIIPGEEIDRMIDIITDINLKYGVLLSVYPVGEKNYMFVNSPLLLNVHKEGVVCSNFCFRGEFC